MSVLSRYFAARASKLVAALLIARSGEGRTATLTYLQGLASPPTVEELSASVYIHFGAIAYALRMTRRLCRRLPSKREILSRRMRFS
jgi:hypothetical protein